MNKLEMVQYLLKQLKGSSHKHEELTEIFENYKTMLLALDGSTPEYRNGLQRLREEFPDLERLVGKKFDAVLKGRLIDGLTAFKNKIEEIENIGKEAPEQPAAPEEGERRVRNIPNLGMS